MTIRSVSEEEVQVVTDLAHRIWPHTFEDILTQEQIAYMLSWMYDPVTLAEQIRSGHHFFVIEDEGIPVGFMGVQLNYPDRNSMKIHKIYVLPELQGKGAGRKLIEMAKDLAFNSGLKSLVLNVNRFNKAVDFYKHLGFDITKEEDIDIGQGYLMEDYVMELVLEDR
jgi:diamine N-acetyltransferase